jgi:putative ABC transport system permease protein
MLTRVSLRRREHAIRLALGATRRPLTAESVVETSPPAPAARGLLAANWLAAAIVALARGDPRLDQVSLNHPSPSLPGHHGHGDLCGLAPARHAGALDVADTLRRRALSAGPGLCVPAQAARRADGLAVLLLVDTGLILRSFASLRQIDLGFDPSRCAAGGSASEPAEQNAWMTGLLARVSAHPEVDAAGAVYLRPLALGPIGQGTQIVLEGQPDTPEAASRNPVLNYQVATPDYFKAMRIPLRRGRVFTADSGRLARVVIVSDTAARSGRDRIIGRRFLTHLRPRRRDQSPADGRRCRQRRALSRPGRGSAGVRPGGPDTLPATDPVIRWPLPVALAG